MDMRHLANLALSLSRTSILFLFLKRLDEEGKHDPPPKLVDDSPGLSWPSEASMYSVPTPASSEKSTSRGHLWSSVVSVCGHLLRPSCTGEAALLLR